MCGHIDPHFQTACHWMTLFIFHILLSPNDPHFQNAFSLNELTPLFRNIHRWKWPACSHWMTPIPTSWYVPNISLEGGIYVVAKRLRAHKMTPFFLQTEVFTKRPLLFFIVLTKWPPIFPLSDHWKTPFFLYLVSHRKTLLLGSCPHIPVTSICDCPPPGHWGGVIHVHTNLENDIFFRIKFNNFLVFRGTTPKPNGFGIMVWFYIIAYSLISLGNG